MQYPIIEFAQWYAALAFIGGAGGVAQFFYTEIYQAPTHDQDQPSEPAPELPKDRLVLNLLSAPSPRRLIAAMLLSHWEWRRLMLMHFLIGALGSLVAVPFGIRLLDIDLSKIGETSTFDSIAKPAFLLIGLAALGGFAGARMLTTMSLDLINKMIDKKADKSETASLGEKSKALNAKTHELEASLASKANELRETQQKFERANFELEVKSLLQGADIAVLTNDPTAATNKCRRFFELCNQHPEYIRLIDKVIAWNILGRAYKKLGQYQKAIDFVDECLSQEDLSPEHRAKMLFNKACYLALAISEKSETSAIADVIALLKQPALKGYITKSDISQEEDFSSLAKHPDFVEFLNTFS